MFSPLLLRSSLLIACLGTLPALGTAAPPAQTPDLVFHDARIYTVDDERPWAEAVAITGDRITAIGSNEEIRALAGPDTRVIDLDGAFVTPGFNDGHVHVAQTGALLIGINLLDVHEPETFVERIAAATERLPPGSWITGGSWGAYEQWALGSSGESPIRDPGTTADEPDPRRERFTPHRDLIDPVSREHPALITRFDRQVALANSLALAHAGIDETTPSPPGGRIVVDDDGRLTGILEGSAIRLVADGIPAKSHELLMREFAAVLAEARESGVTTIQDITSAEMLRVYQDTRDRGELTARVMVRPTLDQVDHVAALGLGRGFGDEWLKFAGYKAWVDGIMGNSSALFFRDYDHDPGNRGFLRDIMLPEGAEGAAMSMTPRDHYTGFPPGNLERLLEAAVPTGIPPHVHAIGTLGVRIALDVFERVLSQNELIGRDHRWRVIHAQVVHPDDVARFGELGLVAEINPYHVSDDMRWMEERIDERAVDAYPFRSLADADAVLVFGSDSPGTNAARYPLNPLYGLYAAITRQTLDGEPAEGWFPKQRLSIEEAIAAYTRNPAWACFEEEIKGTVTPGKLADLAVFDTDLVAAAKEDPSTLLEAEVLYTVVGGRIVHEPGR